MMPKCQWKEKPGLDPVCNTLASPGQSFCPRHAFLEQVRQDQEFEKQRKAAVEGKIVTKLVTTRRELLEQGYQAIGNGTCSGCRALIQWFRTPNGHNAPYNPMEKEDSRAVSHFATCPARQQFRKAAA